MFVTEPIVLWLSLLSGFSDALIFTFMQSFEPVYKQWGFGTIGVGLAFIPYVLSHHVRLPRLTMLQDFTRIYYILPLIPPLNPSFPWPTTQESRICQTRSPTVVATFPGTTRNYRSLWVRLDFARPRPRHTLDSHHGILLHGRHCKCKVSAPLERDALLMVI